MIRGGDRTSPIAAWITSAMAAVCEIFSGTSTVCEIVAQLANCVTQQPHSSAVHPSKLFLPARDPISFHLVTVSEPSRPGRTTFRGKPECHLVPDSDNGAPSMTIQSVTVPCQGQGSVIEQEVGALRGHRPCMWSTAGNDSNACSPMVWDVNTVLRLSTQKLKYVPLPCQSCKWS